MKGKFSNILPCLTLLLVGALIGGAYWIGVQTPTQGRLLRRLLVLY